MLGSFTFMGSPRPSGLRHLTENQYLRLSFQSPAMPAIFQSRIEKKTNKVPPVRVIMICSDLCRDSLKSVDRTSTLEEPILHKIFAIINGNASRNETNEILTVYLVKESALYTRDTDQDDL